MRGSRLYLPADLRIENGFDRHEAQPRWDGCLEVSGAGVFQVEIIIHAIGAICGGDVAKTALLSGGNACWRLVSGGPADERSEVVDELVGQLAPGNSYGVGRVHDLAS